MADEPLELGLPSALGDRRPRLPQEEQPAQGYMPPDPPEVYRDVADPAKSPNRSD